MIRKPRVALVMIAAAAWSCASAGSLTVPDALRRQRAACVSAGETDPLASCAPLILQATYTETTAMLDRPAALDADGSGLLRDDFVQGASIAGGSTVPLYSIAQSDDQRHYLFYGLYYAVDWSGSPRQPRIDHLGDFEGLLVIVARATGTVEAVITQAHRRFYLWTPECGESQRACSGQIALTADGRPIVFVEAGGHGIYTYGAGGFHPRGGTRYPFGPAAVSAARLTAITPALCPPMPAHAECRTSRNVALQDVRVFTEGTWGPFRDLPRGAQPPWRWRDRSGRDGGRPGAIVLDPAALYVSLLRAKRP